MKESLQRIMYTQFKYAYLLHGKSLFLFMEHRWNPKHKYNNFCKHFINGTIEPIASKLN